MKHCLTLSYEQPTIPYRNRNSTVFLYFLILVNATEIINNDYNKVGVLPSYEIKTYMPSEVRVKACHRLFSQENFLEHFHPISTKVCNNILDLKDDAFYFVRRHHCLIQYVMSI